MVQFGVIRKLTWELWTLVLSILLGLAIIRKIVEQHQAGQPPKVGLILALVLVGAGTVLGIATFPRRRASENIGDGVKAFRHKLRAGVFTACLLTSVLLGALFTLAAVMPSYADQWVASGAELSIFQEILLQIAAFWAAYWWLGTLLVILAWLIMGTLLLFAQNRSRTRP